MADQLQGGRSEGEKPDQPEAQPGGSEPQPALPRVEPVGSDAAPYELAPEPVNENPVSTPAPKARKVGEGSFVDDLPDDADLERDPEVERALKGAPLEDESRDETIDEGKPTLVRSGGDPKVLAILGAGVTIGTVVVSGWRNSDHWFTAGLLALNMTLVHTVTGVAATAIVAYFERLKYGKIELAAARMLLAVSVGYLVISLGAGNLNAITAPLGILAYLVILGVLFLMPVPRLIRVAAMHAVFVAAIYFAMILYSAATQSSAVR